MFGFLKRKPSHTTQDEALEFEAEFHQAIDPVLLLMDTDPNKIAVSYGVALAWKFINSKFGSIESFIKMNKTDKLNYISRLKEMENSLSNSENVQVAFGIALVSMFLASVAEGNRSLEQRMAKKLEPLNRLGFPLLTL